MGGRITSEDESTAMLNMCRGGDEGKLLIKRVGEREEGGIG
jgi:hypothetical protein